MSEHTKLIQRLRRAEEDYTLEYGTGDLYELAADALESLTSRVAALERELNEKAAWEKGDDGRLHCPCHFAAERKIAAITERIDELDGILNFANYPAGGPIRSRVSAIRALALRATEQQGKP